MRGLERGSFAVGVGILTCWTDEVALEPAVLFDLFGVCVGVGGGLLGGGLLLLVRGGHCDFSLVGFGGKSG